MYYILVTWHFRVSRFSTDVRHSWFWPQGRGKRILSELSSKPLNIKFIFKIIFFYIFFPINVLSNIRKCCLYSTTCEIITIFASTHSLGSVNISEVDDVSVTCTSKVKGMKRPLTLHFTSITHPGTWLVTWFGYLKSDWMDLCTAKSRD
jgi:hypothetical protein